jgi:opacity protein-like surface antigen
LISLSLQFNPGEFSAPAEHTDLLIRHRRSIHITSQEGFSQGGDMKTKELTIVLFAALLIFGFAMARNAQSQDRNSPDNNPPKFEVIASVAIGHVFRFEDQGFGNHFNFGAGIEVPLWRNLRIGAEINRTFGLSPTMARCGAILSGPEEPLPCVGTAQHGLGSATAGSLTAAYFFGAGRTQPYIVGGVSVLSATEFGVTSIVHPDYVEFVESKSHSMGIGPTLGAGLRVSINRHFSVRPEIRFSDGTALSSLNLSQWRLSVGAAYAW